DRVVGSPGYLASLEYVERRLRAAGFAVTRQPCAPACAAGAVNLLADWRHGGGHPEEVVMFGAHLDSAPDSPGVNDNGSGSAVLLEVALTVAAARPATWRGLRFAWWGDGARGPAGSAFYVGSLTPAQRAAVRVYYNVDAVGSANAGYFVSNLESAQARFLRSWYRFNANYAAPEENPERERSDETPFERAGIATTGLTAGGTGLKTPAQARRWGGSPDTPYDPCRPARCDDVAHLLDPALDRASDAIADAAWREAVVFNPPLPNQPDYLMQLNPGAGTVAAGGAVTTGVRARRVSIGHQLVTLSIAYLPPGVTATFDRHTLDDRQTATLRLAADPGTPAGTYHLAVVGTGAQYGVQLAVYTLTVLAQPPPASSFTVALEPAAATVPAGNGADPITVRTAIASGVSQAVSFSAIGVPAGVTVRFHPPSVSTGGQVVMVVDTSVDTRPGTYPITVVGDGERSDATATYTLTVTARPDGPCTGLSSWRAGASYVPGDLVIHGGARWESTWYSTGAEPGAPISWNLWANRGGC
ncbi:MAG TPA: M28 family peptidase, partial [Pilimelia sp.]|nr:M28 family peptidase [Pilimelia sp.]